MDLAHVLAQLPAGALALLVVALLGVVWWLGRDAIISRVTAITTRTSLVELGLSAEKQAREAESREIRAQLETVRQAQHKIETEKANLEGRLLGLQSSIDERADQQDRVLLHQNRILDRIESRVVDIDDRKQSRSMAAARPPIPRQDPPSDPPPLRPKLPSKRFGDGE